MSCKLEIRNLGIMRGQYLIDVLPIIPSNVIVNKTVTGIGATFSEIKAPRNSIIVEPNLPVIHGKCNQEKHRGDNLLGVYEGKSKDYIIRYLEKSMRDGKFIKIMTTPESIPKVVSALSHTGIDITSDCFLLFDECEKTVKDNNYRDGITLPMDLFFECKNKAMVSATPITELADPRFRNFEIIKILPSYDYRININLQSTNNVLQRIKEIIPSLLQTRKPLFIFLNYTDMIHALMEALNVLKQSAVFCSEKSVDKLKQKGFQRAYNEWGQDKMMQINWLTSRFYSAHDIELVIQPHVLMITEVFFAPYTMFDPFTDSVQVVGRFRRGVSSFTHISNWNYHYLIRSRNFHYAILERQMNEYLNSKKLFDAATSQAEKDALYDILQCHPFNKFINRQGQINFFRIDNFVDDEVLKSAYQSWWELEKAYKNSGHFNITHHVERYAVGEYERLQIQSKSMVKIEKQKIIVEQLEQLGKCETEMEMEYKRALREADKTIVDAYDELGKSKIEELKYSTTKIKEAIIMKEHKRKARSTNVIKAVYNRFIVGRRYSSNEIKTILSDIYRKMEVPTPPAVTAETIKLYFDVGNGNTNTERGYYLNRRLI